MLVPESRELDAESDRSNVLGLSMYLTKHEPARSELVASAITSPRLERNAIIISVVDGWPKFIRNITENGSKVANSIIDMHSQYAQP